MNPVNNYFELLAYLLNEGKAGSGKDRLEKKATRVIFKDNKGFNSSSEFLTPPRKPEGGRNCRSTGLGFCVLFLPIKKSKREKIGQFYKMSRGNSGEFRGRPTN